VSFVASFNGVGGNRLRLKPVKTIKTDKSWERNMPVWKQWIVSLLMFGYQRSLSYTIVGRISQEEWIK
jgi:hypothetical protein